MLSNVFFTILSLAMMALAAPMHAENHGNAWKYGTGGGVLGFVVLIIDIIIILEVLKSSRTVPSKILWSLLVFLFPIIGAIIYFLFSNREAHKTNSGYEPIP